VNTIASTPPERKFRVIQARDHLGAKAAKALLGKFVDESHYDVLYSGEDVKIMKPGGKPLCIYITDCISPKNAQIAYRNLRNAATITTNRGVAAGMVDPSKITIPVGKLSKSGLKYLARKSDGEIGRTLYSNNAQSGVIGYMDRYARIPYCRMTAFNIDHYKQFQRSLPFVHEVDAVFAHYAPERHAAQMKMIAATEQAFTIKGTAFTTVTVNKNFRTAAHTDAGDYRGGYGVMAVLTHGDYQGCYLVFPRYRVAVNMRMGGVCLANVHEVHGNTPFVGAPGYERVSCVFYYREKMFECSTPAEEAERAKFFADKMNRSAARA